jgi:hypothetical protein
MKAGYLILALTALLASCCTKPEGPGQSGVTEGKQDVSFLADPVFILPEEPLTRDTIPDFSRVGYHWGEDAFPDYANVVRVAAPTGGDDTSLIQDAIDSAPERSVILLQEGTYRVDSIIMLDRSGLVLRGSGDKATTIRAAGKTLRHVVVMGRVMRDAAGARIIKTTSKSIAGVGTTVHYLVKVRTPQLSAREQTGPMIPLVGDAFCGAAFVEVSDPSSFNVGDRVSLYRPATAGWLDAIHMREIVQAATDEDVITQWTPAAYGMWWDRTVVGVEGRRIWLDNPVVMSMTSGFGGGMLVKTSWDRISESGVENLVFESEFDSSVVEDGMYIDEEHASTAVLVGASEHCRVKDITVRYFSTSAVDLSSGAQNITVEDCRSLSPVSRINGGWRYAFHISGGGCCLVRNCLCDEDRHGFVLGTKVPGPNAFVDCIGERMYSILGPHQRWSTGCLYDNCVTSGGLVVKDAGNSGTGQGWQGANMVFWNCRASSIVCQSPWASALNWSVGSTPRATASASYAAGDNLGRRPLGVVRDRLPGEPERLYDTQLQERLAAGRRISNASAL